MSYLVTSEKKDIILKRLCYPATLITDEAVGWQDKTKHLVEKDLNVMDTKSYAQTVHAIKSNLRMDSNSYVCQLKNKSVTHSYDA